MGLHERENFIIPAEIIGHSIDVGPYVRKLCEEYPVNTDNKNTNQI
jgi:hypothetical protein